MNDRDGQGLHPFGIITFGKYMFKPFRKILRGFRQGQDAFEKETGDLIDKASQLFGYYPKTGQMAARQGEIVAHQIAARAAGKTAETQLPDSTCHVINRVEPLETTQIDTTYRLRGDGLIQQTMRQHYNAQASDEDLRWAQAMFAELGF